ncbi:predicted protein [Chaetomium globosum CBS 148.51]|uniref:Transmembrane protein n=1 Tax=Chaetomium globosum (strain ATCC 6205 / CBS 148.51 / DSM 1962 / NBRC 6347 / NRRL 1970) TaxID=306901 RepID=Q2GVN9_CHAGB|nr:uncharacterized protein CHGG_07965 [Chaetomium globosum CBS 148.51]EAQ86712.1 predicted protein [Chaetomium globosum CBS 148.51]
MARAYFSPYAPRRRRSPQVVVVWVSMFAFILWLTWYITTRHKEYADEFMHPREHGQGPSTTCLGGGHPACGMSAGLHEIQRVKAAITKQQQAGSSRR